MTLYSLAIQVYETTAIWMPYVGATIKSRRHAKPSLTATSFHSEKERMSTDFFRSCAHRLAVLRWVVGDVFRERLRIGGDHTTGFSGSLPLLSGGETLRRGETTGCSPPGDEIGTRRGRATLRGIQWRVDAHTASRRSLEDACAVGVGGWGAW